MSTQTSLSPEEIQRHNKLWDQACGLLEGLVILDDHLHKAPGFFARRKLRKAVRLFQQVLELDPANWQSMVFIGKAFQSLGEFDQSLSWLLRAHDCVPTEPIVAIEAGGMAGRLGRHDVAVRVMQAASKEHPGEAELFLNLGLSQLMSGKPADASEAFARAVELEPQRDMNRRLRDLAREVVAGKQACPKSEAEIAAVIQPSAGRGI